jgi:hypothetical protein
VWWPLDASAVRGILAPAYRVVQTQRRMPQLREYLLQVWSAVPSAVLWPLPHRATNHTGKPHSDRALERANRIRKRLGDDVFSALRSMSSRPSRCACAG